MARKFFSLTSLSTLVPYGAKYQNSIKYTYKINKIERKANRKVRKDYSATKIKRDKTLDFMLVLILQIFIWLFHL